VRPPFVPFSWTVEPKEGSLLDFDPCGCICDIMRSAYTRKTEFFTGGERPLTIRWYRAPPGAKPLPFPSSFMSLNWWNRPYEASGIGEIYTGPPRWSNGRTPPTARGIAPYGPAEYFANGQPYNPDGPVVPRDFWGLATACTGSPAPDVAAASAVLGISAEGED
jgi:hypothetical protein